MHIYLGFPDPPSSTPTLHGHYSTNDYLIIGMAMGLVQRGIGCNYANTRSSPYRRLPLTPHSIKLLWLPNQCINGMGSYMYLLLWIL